MCTTQIFDVKIQCSLNLNLNKKLKFKRQFMDFIKIKKIYIVYFATIMTIINTGNPCSNFCASFKPTVNITIQLITKFLNLIQIFFQSVNATSSIRSNSIANRTSLIFMTSKIKDKFINLLGNMKSLIKYNNYKNCVSTY